MEFLFDSKNKYILHDAVEENKQKLVDKILELVPHWIDRLSPIGYTILHTALGGKAKLVMIKTLLEAMPKLIHESNKEGLTPIKFGEKHSFGGAKSEEEIIEMRKLLEDYEKKNIEVEAFTREEMEELGYYLYEHIDITTLG